MRGHTTLFHFFLFSRSLTTAFIQVFYISTFSNSGFGLQGRKREYKYDIGMNV